MGNSAQRIADGLGAKRFGNSWRCPCPVCGEKNESKFKIAEGDKGPLVYCFAGCEFRDIVRELKAQGLWEDDANYDPKRPSRRKLEWCRWVVKIVGETPPADLSEQDRKDYNVARKLIREYGG